MSDAKRISRREVLTGGAAVAAGAIGFPTIIPSHVLAAPGREGANDRIGIGIIGPGRQGSAVLADAAKRGRVVAVADVNLPRAQACASKHNAKAFQDYRKMLELKEVDAVIVATPDHWRVLCCIHAAQAGKDMYAEKCLTLTIREGRVLVDAIRKYKRVFQTGSQQRSMAANRLGCELVRNGHIGKVHTVIGANYPSPWECAMRAKPILEGLDWDTWCGPVEPVPFHNDLYAPRANPGWLSFRQFSGGEMTGWGSHGLDQIQWALGMDESGPVEVWVEGPKFDPPTYTDAGPRAVGEARCKQPMIFYRYENGTVVRLDNGPEGGAVFIGDRGKITIDRAKVKSDPVEIVKEPAKENELHLYRSDDHMRNWFECMKSRRPCVADVETGHRSSTVCHLGNIARWLNRKLKWDPARETFAGDEEANAYLDRKRRQGYELPEKV
ncbi:MAG: Gfo/Idh/MocA family oxidoreductase [Phycisphaerae bacterium]|nr:Gfo/Idh/MocA family oxidoreductase [Phycisphaerae bacterium]